MKKIILIIICIISILSTIIIFLSTYSKYSEDAEATMENQVGKWIIKLNNTDITQGISQDFLIQNIVIEENTNVIEGKIAPGTSGYFDIEINPAGTQVAVRYDITLNKENITNDEIQITSVSELNGNTLTRTAENVYTGIIPLADVENGNVNSIRISIDWNNNELNNENDSQTGNKANSVLEIPITVDVCQYLGESIVEFNN